MTQSPGLTVGSSITTSAPGGAVQVLATVTAPGLATCSQLLLGDRRCGCPIQRSSKGDLLDGVRAPYKTVHPERGVG